MVGRDVAALLERDPVELLHREEQAVAEHALELEVRAHLRFVEVVLGLADLFGVVGPVPAGDGEVAAFGLDLRLDVGRFALHVGHHRRHQVVEHLVDRVRRLGHLVVEREGGGVRESEQRGAFGAQGGDAQDALALVEGIAADAAADRGFEHALAAVAVGERSQHRLAGGVLQGDQPLAFQPPLLGGVGGGADLGLGEAGERFGGIEHHRGVVDLLEQVLAEGGLQGGHLLVDRAHLRLAGVVEQRAGAHELLVVALGEAAVFRVRGERITRVVDRLDAGEQLGIEEDLVLVLGELGRDLGLDLLQRFAGVRAGQVVEHLAGAVEHDAAALHRHQGVVERRGLGVVGDRADLGEVLLHAFFEGRQVVLVADLREVRRQQRQGAGLEERIGGDRGGRGRGGL